jgi:hypothetical protein
MKAFVYTDSLFIALIILLATLQGILQFAIGSQDVATYLTPIPWEIVSAAKIADHSNSPYLVRPAQHPLPGRALRLGGWP